jgi:peptidoglycan/xylan/chitin deacetylase (PgdA/CDA1 family)
MSDMVRAQPTAPMDDKIVLLMYHELELPARPLCRTEPGYVRYVVTCSNFQAQMNWLSQAGWRGLTLTETLKFEGGKAVAITFDDGSETDVTVAAPVLKEYGFGATIYVTAGFLGNQGYMSAAQLRQLSENGFEIGSHSMTHRYLPELDDADLHGELLQSKFRLEEIVGKPIRHFSCPGGRYSRRVASLAREAGYDTVANSRPRANTRSSDHYALGRVAIMRGTGLGAFQSICDGRDLWKIELRDYIRGAAKRVLGNRLYDSVRDRALLKSRTS